MLEGKRGSEREIKNGNLPLRGHPQEARVLLSIRGRQRFLWAEMAFVVAGELPFVLRPFGWDSL